MPPLQDLFETHALVKILDFLTLYKDFEYTRTDIANETGISRRTLYEVFPKLEEFNLVEVTKSFGNVKFYKLNAKNPISKYLTALADEIALYEAEKATGIELSTQIQPNTQAIKPSVSEDSQISVSFIKVQAKSASEVMELMQKDWTLTGEATVTATNSTQNDFAEAIQQLKKSYAKKDKT
jgi:DNA-binding transcriptional regulator GbsR (MarR family)